MIVVTGGAGFIGSNLVRGLNARGRDDILVVDNLTDGTKFRNLADCRIADYVDKDDFLPALEAGRAGALDAIFHQGACSDTTEWDGRYMMANNFSYSKRLLRPCLERRVPFIYASSGAVYGRSGTQREEPTCEAPLNIYGYSKALFDAYVRRLLPGAESQIAGLRYFNVYGPHEQHKGGMASMAYQLFHQVRSDGRARLFAGSDGYGDGEQRRDFVYVDDVVDVNLWFLDHPDHSGLFNVGAGAACPFNDLARAVIDGLGRGWIDYVPLPPRLEGRYQSFTEADISRLRAAGCDVAFRDVGTGMRSYVNWLTANEPVAPPVADRATA